MRIIADSIKDHLIPQLSSKETPKEMYDALARMYEGRNINRKMKMKKKRKKDLKENTQKKKMHKSMYYSLHSLGL